MDEDDDDPYQENTSNGNEVALDDDAHMIDDQPEEYSATRSEENTMQGEGCPEDAEMSDARPHSSHIPPSPDSLPTPPINIEQLHLTQIKAF